jgi:hypothetical protein
MSDSYREAVSLRTAIAAASWDQPRKISASYASTHETKRSAGTVTDGEGAVRVGMGVTAFRWRE